MIGIIKKSIVCLVLLVGAISIAKAESRETMDCQSRLTNNFQDRTLMVNYHYNSDVVRNYGKIFAETIAVLRLFVEDKGCARGVINFGKCPNGRSNSRCRLVERYSPTQEFVTLKQTWVIFLYLKESSTPLICKLSLTFGISRSLINAEMREVNLV